MSFGYEPSPVWSRRHSRSPNLAVTSARYLRAVEEGAVQVPGGHAHARPLLGPVQALASVAQPADSRRSLHSRHRRAAQVRLARSNADTSATVSCRCSAAHRTNTTTASSACTQRSSIDHQPVSSGSAPAAISTAPCTQWRRLECPTLPRAGDSGSIRSARPSSSSRRSPATRWP